jgi:cytochrome bd-type quinol oxidase subunit 2
MGELLALLFCATIGFVLAGVVASFYQLLTSEPADFFMPRATVSGNVVAVLLTMFGGPLFVMRRVVEGLRRRDINVLPAAAGVLFAGMWSVVAGIVFLSFFVRG